MKSFILLIATTLLLSGLLFGLAEDMPVIDWTERTPAPTTVPTSGPVEELERIPALTQKNNELTNLSVGDTVEFGSYEQDNEASNGKEPIEWIVLGMDDNTATLISKYALDCKLYNSNTNYLTNDVTWETSTLRNWLNGEFYSTAFNTEEQERIVETETTNRDNVHYGIDGGSDTLDRVYLLSIDEAENLFTSCEERKCEPTEFAKALRVYISEGTCGWWLRSPGSSSYYAANVRSDGSLNNTGLHVARGFSAIRPVVVLRLS